MKTTKQDEVEKKAGQDWNIDKTDGWNNLMNA